MRNLAFILSTLLAMVALATGCSETRQFTGECTTNSECPVGAFCKGGLCACRSDEACGPGEECNNQDVCQKRAGCRQNEQCPDPATQFCDLASGNCIDKVVVDGASVRAGCNANVHCDPGTICDEGNQVCIDGCFEDADCQLYRVCDRTGTSSSTPGRCLPGRCTDRSFCAFGEVCVNGACQASGNAAHCAPCDNTTGSCGQGNFCLINTSYDAGDPSTGSEFFCGVGCDINDDTCPNGYQCGRVQRLTGDLCTQNTQCCGPDNAAECCPDGQRDCQGRRVCAIGEGDARGACTCLRDEDCIQRTIAPTCAGSCGGFGIQACFDDTPCITSCDTSPQVCIFPRGQRCTQDSECSALPVCGDVLGDGMNRCFNTGQPCTDAIECMCVMGECANIPGRACGSGADCTLRCEGGGCILGATCAPTEGLLCTDVR